MSFGDLAANEVEGQEFRVVVKGCPGIAIVAPHGGRIETHTSDIAAAIASEDHALYLFVGCADQENRRLRVISRHFGEPRGWDIVRR